MSSGQSRSDLIRVFQRLVKAQARNAKQLCERSPGHELHDDKIVAIFGTQLVDLNDIRMVQRSHCPRLALESPGEAPLGDLDGNRAIQTCVARAKNLSHPACAQSRFDSVLPQLSPGGEARIGGFFAWFPDRPVQARVATVLFQQRLHFVKEFLVAARCRGQECRACFRIALQCRMV